MKPKSEEKMKCQHQKRENCKGGICTSDLHNEHCLVCGQHFFVNLIFQTPTHPDLITKSVEEFGRLYISEFRWKKDRITELSAEDWLANKLTAVAKEAEERGYKEGVNWAVDKMTHSSKNF